MSKISNNLMHLGLRVKDYQKSLEFYCGVFGFEKMFEFTMKDFYEMLGEAAGPGKVNEKAVWLAYLRIKDEQYLEIFPVPDEEVVGYDPKQSFFHLSLQVDNIVEKVKELRARGVKVYSLHKDIIDDRPAPRDFVPLRGKCGSLIAWIEDPDGNMIEIMELTDRSLQRKHDKRLREAGADKK